MHPATVRVHALIPVPLPPDPRIAFGAELIQVLSEADLSMLTLHRERFPDVPMSADMLDAAAELWLSWYRLARIEAPEEQRPFHRVEAFVWSFPRPRAESLQQLVARQVETSQLADSNADDNSSATAQIQKANNGPQQASSPLLTVERPNPDTLSVATPWLEFSHACRLSLVSNSFMDDAFGGLPMMLRITVAEYGNQPRLKPALSRTLVLCGKWTAGTLIVKAIWTASTFETEDRIYAKAPWALESRFLDDLETFRRSGQVNRGWETEFAPQVQARFADRIVRSFVIVPGQPKLRVFMKQVILFLAILLAGLFVLSLRLVHPLQLLFGIALTGGSAFVLLYITYFRIWAIGKRRSLMQQSFKLLYSRPLSLIPAKLVDLGMEDDPSLLKFSAELEALGCQHCGDLISESHEESFAVHRHYILPAERTFLSLGITVAAKSLKFFPGTANLVSSSYFDDDHRLACSNSSLPSNKTIVPNVSVCHWPNVADPETFLNLLRGKLDQMLVERRRSASPMTLDDHLKRLKSDFALVGEYKQKNGYFSWRDAIRQEFRKGQ